MAYASELMVRAPECFCKFNFTQKPAPEKPKMTILPVRPKLPGELTGKLNGNAQTGQLKNIANSSNISSPISDDSDNDLADDDMFYPEGNNAIKFK